MSGGFGSSRGAPLTREDVERIIDDRVAARVRAIVEAEATSLFPPRSMPPTAVTPSPTNGQVLSTVNGLAAWAASGGGLTLGSATPLMDGVAAPGTSVNAIREDHVHPTDTSCAPLAGASFTGDVVANAGLRINQVLRFDNPTTSYTAGSTLSGTSSFYRLLDSTAGIFTVNLPASPAAGQTFLFVDKTGACATNAVTIGRNGNKIQGATTDWILNTAYAAVWLVWNGTDNWEVVSVGNPAPIASPTFTGTPRVPTATALDNSTKAASTAYVDAATGAASTVRPAVSVYKTAAQNLAAAVTTLITFDAELYDTDTMHDLVTNNSRLVATATGTYQVNATIEMANNAAASSWGAVRKNAAGSSSGGTQISPTVAATTNVGTSFERTVNISFTVQLVAGDYLELFGFQNTAGTVAISTGSSATRFDMAWVGGTGSAWGNSGAKARSAAAITLAAGVEKLLTFDTEDFDVDNTHSTLSNTERFTCVTPGKFLLIGHVGFTASAASDKYVRVYKNGAADHYIAAAPASSAANSTIVAVCDVFDLNAGDYLHLTGVSSIASSVDIANTRLSLVRVGYQTNPNSPPNARAYRSGAQTISTSAWTVVGLDAESHDSGALHDLLINNTRVVAPAPGLYQVRGRVTFASNVTGYRVGAIEKNAAGVHTIANIIDLATTPIVNGDVSTILLSSDVRLAAGDYVELFCWQNSGGLLGLTAGTSNTFLELRRVAD